MTGPTLALEHIANYDYDGVETFEVEDLHALLASELIALREQVASNDAETDRRLCAIEASASSGGRPVLPPYIEAHETITRLANRASTAEAARDEARRERDEWITKCCDWMERCRIAISERDEARSIAGIIGLEHERDSLQQQLAAMRSALEGVVLCERCSICPSNARAALNTSTPANTEEGS